MHNEYLLKIYYLSMVRETSIIPAFPEKIIGQGKKKFSCFPSGYITMCNEAQNISKKINEPKNKTKPLKKKMFWILKMLRSIFVIVGWV